MFEALILTWAIIDGDTMRVTARVWPGVVVEERVRLLEVDTPERFSSLVCERQLAEAASQWARTRLSAAKVITVRSSEKDSFGRILAYVYADGLQVNAEMLSAGIARPYGTRGAWC